MLPPPMERLGMLFTAWASGLASCEAFFNMSRACASAKNAILYGGSLLYLGFQKWHHGTNWNPGKRVDRRGREGAEREDEEEAGIWCLTLEPTCLTFFLNYRLRQALDANRPI